MLYNLLEKSDYMIIVPLMELISAKYASEVYGKTPEEIRKRFDITYIPTEAEIQKNGSKLF